MLPENKVNHHYVGGYYGAASEEEMKRELVSCRNLCQGSKVHKTVRHPHFWKVMLASGGLVSKLHSAPNCAVERTILYGVLYYTPGFKGVYN